MTGARPVILLTGRPGIGKSTVIMKVVQLLGSDAGGFYTREVRADGGRTGFEIVTLDGETSLLATKQRNVAFTRGAPFGSYRVNLGSLESLAVPSLLKAMAEGKAIVIDEIGPMEILSEPFRQAILAILENPQATVVGTIVQRPHPFADGVKAHPRVELKPVTVDNRDRLPEEIYSSLGKWLADDEGRVVPLQGP